MLLVEEAEEVDWKQRCWQDGHSVRERPEICRGLYMYCELYFVYSVQRVSKLINCTFAILCGK